VAGSLPAPRGLARRRYLDWLRGIAVLIMVEAHAFDAWTRFADRSSAAYGYLILFGGIAAPMFLWLAGLGGVMSAQSTLSRTGQRSMAMEAVVRRGLEIFLLAFLFRLQAFVVSPGKPLVSLFRVDILNVMGPAIACAGVLWGIARGPRGIAVACGVGAVLFAMVTPILQVADAVAYLPTWVQWYVRPSGDNTTFTMFPWAGFVFAGAASGAILAAATDERRERWAVGALTVAGACVLALGWYTAKLPSIYQSSSFWTSSPTYFAVRTGILMLALGASYVARPLASVLPRATDVLERFGRNSLFVYWIHVELVYGYATWLIHKRLPIWAGALVYLAFCGGLYWAVLRKEAWERRRKARWAGDLAQPQGAAAAV
jgi:uncharacterized membrane protein